MQVAEHDWTGIIVALLIALALIAGQFLIHRAYQAWIRWRTGITATGRRTAPIEPTDEACEPCEACEACPEDGTYE